MERLTKRVHGLADISDAMLPDLDWEDYLAKIMERLCAYEDAEEQQISMEQAGTIGAPAHEPLGGMHKRCEETEEFPAQRNDGNEVRNGMPDIEIYWNDLTVKKQQEILDVLGENGNYDIFPIATISYEPELGSMDEPQM